MKPDENDVMSSTVALELLSPTYASDRLRQARGAAIVSIRTYAKSHRLTQTRESLKCIQCSLTSSWYAVEDPERYVALSKESLDEWARGLRKDG